MNMKLLAAAGILAASIGLYQHQYTRSWVAHYASEAVSIVSNPPADEARQMQASARRQPLQFTSRSSVSSAKAQTGITEAQTGAARAQARIVKPQTGAAKAQTDGISERTQGSQQAKRPPAQELAHQGSRSTPQASPQRSLEERCVLGPAILQSRMDGRIAQQKLYAQSTPAQYLLHEGDDLSIRLPDLTQKQRAQGYSIKWITTKKNSPEANSILQGRKIDYASLRTVHGRLTGKAYVGLLKGGKLHSSYEINIIAAAAEQVATAQSNQQAIPSQVTREQSIPEQSSLRQSVQSYSTPQRTIQLHDAQSRRAHLQPTERRDTGQKDSVQSGDRKNIIMLHVKPYQTGTLYRFPAQRSQTGKLPAYQPRTDELHAGRPFAYDSPMNKSSVNKLSTDRLLTGNLLTGNLLAYRPLASASPVQSPAIQEQQPATSVMIHTAHSATPYESLPLSYGVTIIKLPQATNPQRSAARIR